MFSEYASRFLAQSQSVVSQSDRGSSPAPSNRSSSRAPSRARYQRQPHGNPYQPQSSRYPFASRFTSQHTQAPLFFSAADQFREEDDDQDHERGAADYYALHRSRRDLKQSRTTESDESDREAPAVDKRRSGWFGQRSRAIDGRSGQTSRHGKEESARQEEVELLPQDKPRPRLDSESTNRLEDVELTSTIAEDHEISEAETRRDPETDSDEGSIPGRTARIATGTNKLSQARKGAVPQTLPPLLRPRPPSPDVESAQPDTDFIQPQPPQARHDSFWSTLYFLSIAAMVSSFLLSLLHNPAPPDAGFLGDTIYTTLHSSFYLLAVDTLVATIVALFWLAMLRSFVRPLVLLILVAVPVIAFSFSLYPFISSFQGYWHGSSIQDRAMRWLALVPALFAIGWTYTAYKSRHSLGRSIELLEFSTRVLAANPALVLVGFATLFAVVTWTWLWMLMFTRLFLGGHMAKNLFLIDTGTWCLAIFFVLNYLWTLSIFSGIQRATSAATVSQWYFHRLVNPDIASPRVVRAAFDHAITSLFGTICLASLTSLAVRLPLLALPRRLTGVIALCFYTLVPTSIATVTNPLTLTYAAIHSQGLIVSAQGLADMAFLPSRSPTTTLTPGSAARSSNGNPNAAPSLVAYRLAKLLLHATRFVTALAFGFGGWVSTARMLTVQDSSSSIPAVRGSLYAYVIGLIAGAIGWAVLGAMEGVLSGVLDAVVVCWGSEVGKGGDLRAGAGMGYCREAGELLGGDVGGEVEGREAGGGGIGL